MTGSINCRCVKVILTFTQNEIDNPTTPNVFASLSAVVQNVLVVATGILKCVGKNRHWGEVTAFIRLAGERKNGGREPYGFNEHGTEGIAEGMSRIKSH